MRSCDHYRVFCARQIANPNSIQSIDFRDRFLRVVERKHLDRHRLPIQFSHFASAKSLSESRESFKQIADRRDHRRSLTPIFTDRTNFLVKRSKPILSKLKEMTGFI